MGSKMSEEKLLKLITKVNDALNAQGKKVSAKINDILDETTELKGDVESLKSSLNDKCDCYGNVEEVRPLRKE